MRYMGSKAQVPLPYEILKDRKPGQLYIEPFVGSASCITQVLPNWFIDDGPRVGADKNPYLIALLQALQLGWKPEQHMTKEEYDSLREQYKAAVIPDDFFERARMGYAGCGCGFRGKFFDSYVNTGGHGIARGGSSKDYIAEFYKSLPSAQELSGIKFVCSDYVDLAIPNGSLVYCDPPYENTTKYQYGIDHGFFWKWCEELVTRNCQVFVSSYESGIPANWHIVWRKRHRSTMANTRSKPVTEVVATFSN